MKKLILLIFLTLSFNSFAMVEYKAKVMGMVCSFCAEGIEKQLTSLKGIIGVKVDLDNYLVHIQSKAALEEKDITKKIVDAGYKVESIEEVKDEKVAK